MISTWQKTWSRVSAMSRDELLTRALQYAGNRFDLVKYRAGLRENANSLKPTQSTVNGKFFFSPEELPHRIGLLREHLSLEADRIIREADDICVHRFRLLGYNGLDYGPEIDWQLDAVSRQRAPHKPGFKIPFLDFSQVGDHKVIWELNRHQHLVTLAKAWALSHNEKYAAEFTEEWYSWKLANPYPMGINWASSLEVAFRSLSWLWARALLQGSPSLTPGFDSDLSQALALNGRYIERNLSTYFSPNTHLLGEAVALFFIGTLCPEISASGGWRDRGWQILVQEAERQVRTDGTHFEQSLYYHVYALDLFLHARVLAARNRMDIPRGFDETLERMLTFLRAVSQGGPPIPFGDDDGGRVFDHARNRSEHLTDPLALGAVLFRRDDSKSEAHLTEEVIWLFGREALSLSAASSPRPAIRSASFEVGGFFVMASSEHFAQRMVIDAGPQGDGRAGHGHADALSITLSLDGREWLVDPGTFCYVSADGERDQFRGTCAHNTLRVDGLDQAVAQGLFSWSSLPQVQAERWITGNTFSLFTGNHAGYDRLADPVVHRRTIFHLHGGFWLVRDFAVGRESHLLETSWHFAPDLSVSDLPDAFVCFPPQESADSNTRLALLPIRGPGWTCTLEQYEVSPVYGTKRSAPVLRMRARAHLPVECAILIAPLLRASDQPGKLDRLQGDESGLSCGYRYTALGCVHYAIFSRARATWSLGPWTSDAEVVYCATRDGEFVHFILCNGTFAALNKAPVVTPIRKIDRLEWLSRSGSSGIFVSDEQAEMSFSEDALRSCEVAF